MEETLFRGKRKDTGEWIEGYYMKGKWYLNEEDIHLIFQVDGVIYPRNEFPEYEEVDPETVRQWSGLVDKNGVKIFEGDIVQVDGMTSSITGCYRVVYSEPIHCWALKRNETFHNHFFTFYELNGFAENSVVVGNIHDDTDAWVV